MIVIKGRVCSPLLWRTGYLVVPVGKPFARKTIMLPSLLKNCPQAFMGSEDLPGSCLLQIFSLPCYNPPL